MVKYACFLAILLGATLSVLGQKWTISGYVVSEEGQEALTGVSVVDSLSGKGTYTNAYGFFSLTLTAGSVALRAGFTSYASQTRTFVLQKDTSIQFSLFPLSLSAVVITAESQKNQPKLGQLQFSVEQLEQVPALFGEVDVLKALALAPGVSTGIEGTSGLLVRGGSTDQNLLLLDGAPVYNASHLFGFLSVFNSDAIRQLDMYKGNFPARYGGRLSSVVDIRLKEGNAQKHTGKANIGLLTSKVLREGPLGERSSFLISGRASYLGLFLLPVYLSYQNGGADTYFNYWLYDLNAKVNHEFRDGSRLFLSVYGGQDYWRVRDGDPRQGADRFGLTWGNQTATLRYTRLLGDKLFLQSQMTFSRYRYQIETASEAPRGSAEEDEVLLARSKVRDLSAQVQWDYYPSPVHELRWGLTAIRHQFSPGRILLSGSIDSTFGDVAIPATELGIFVEDQISLFSWCELDVGMRWSAFFVENTQYQGWEPRIGTRFSLSERFSLSMAYGRMNQYLHLLSNNGAGLPNDIWVPPTDEVPPQQADQWSLGIAHTLPRWGVNWSLEGYYKPFSGLIDYRQGIDFATSISANWQELVEVGGTGLAYGAELLIRKPAGRFNGWLAYTLSWNQRQFAQINNGLPYPGRFDRRHDFSLTGSYELSDRWKLSATWQFQTGRPVTLPIASHLVTLPANAFFRDPISLVYEGRNQSRMPAYHRLDIGATLFPDGTDHRRSWSFGVYNAYNRQNPFFLDIQPIYAPVLGGGTEFSGTKLVQWSLFPFLPYASYQWEF
ncbi:MAG: carboxypeptidase-like regulatory domain-containing protein [Bacteroidota bacterium]